MPDADFFARLGLFLRREFLDRKFCEELCAEIKAAQGGSETTWGGSERGLVFDETVQRRKVTRLETSACGARVRQNLTELVTRLQEHFQVTLGGSEKPAFLLHPAGDSYAPHSDG